MHTTGHDIIRLIHMAQMCGEGSVSWLSLTENRQYVWMVYTPAVPLWCMVPHKVLLGSFLFIHYDTSMSVIIHHHFLSWKLAGITQLHQSACITEWGQLISSTNIGSIDLKAWILHNKPSCSSVTEIIFAPPKKHYSVLSDSDFMQIWDHISIFVAVHSCGFILNQALSFKNYVLIIYGVAYLKLHRSAIHHYLSADATGTIFKAYVMSGFNYCESLLAAIPSHFLCSLHWQYMLFSMCFSEYQSELLTIYTPVLSASFCFWPHFQNLFFWSKIKWTIFFLILSLNSLEKSPWYLPQTVRFYTSSSVCCCVKIHMFKKEVKNHFVLFL